MESSFEKWLWIDLIGFDAELPDCGVPALLEKAQFVPAVVSLLLHNAEFVHLHVGVDDTRGFPPDVCSYGGHPSNEERQRQVWTPPALHRLVRVLQGHGVHVVFSVFDSGTPDGWREHHPEIGYVRGDGERSPSICPWKRLADGTFYEDFFVQQLQKVMRDYGFDGFHGADGYAHPRFALHDADFSDDMIGQFVEETGDSLPPEIQAACETNSVKVAQRAKWIWTRRRGAWIEFHARRAQRFWRKVAEMLHAQGKMLALNTCWTRDPFEAIYRFGTDYQALAEAGADAFIVEAAGAVQELGGDLPYGTAYGHAWEGWDPARILCRFQTTIMLIKAAVPDTKLVFLNGVKDTNEIWNGLRHAPTNLESEITMHGNVFIRRADGHVTRCTNGPVVCLADGIRSEEWEWLNQVWQRAFDWPVRSVPGATVLWSDTVAQRHLQHYIKTRQCPAGRLLYELVARGAPLYTIQRAGDLAETAEPIVVLHPQLYADDELEAVFDRARGPLFLIGSRPRFLPPGLVEECVSSDDANALWCGVYGIAEDLVSFPVLPPSPNAREDIMSMPEPPSWIYELPMQPVAPEFLAGCATAIAEASDAPRVLENADSVRVWAAESALGVLRLFLRNDSFYYRVAKVDVRHEIRAIRVQTQFPGNPILFDGTCFHVKIPGKGVVIADLDLID
ncbi:MAG: hypothetical protein KAI66_06540 [Lentisphaeria bacterium]|nr:hypothetical protein [Lentisphaeria bacterium]